MALDDLESVKVKTPYWDIAADIYFPPDFDKTKKYPAIVSVHPIGSCKEQTSGNIYGTALADEGFVVIAFGQRASRPPLSPMRYAAGFSCGRTPAIDGRPRV